MSKKMIIKKEYFKKYLFMMVEKQLLDDYRQQGFEVKTQYPISSGFRADIYAVRGEERVVVEIVDGNIHESVMERMKSSILEEGLDLKIIDISKVEIEK